MGPAIWAEWSQAKRSRMNHSFKGGKRGVTAKEGAGRVREQQAAAGRHGKVLASASARWLLTWCRRKTCRSSRARHAQMPSRGSRASARSRAERPGLRGRPGRRAIGTPTGSRGLGSFARNSLRRWVPQRQGPRVCSGAAGRRRIGKALTFRHDTGVGRGERGGGRGERGAGAEATRARRPRPAATRRLPHSHLRVQLPSRGW